VVIISRLKIRQEALLPEDFLGRGRQLGNQMIFPLILADIQGYLSDDYRIMMYPNYGKKQKYIPGRHYDESS